METKESLKKRIEEYNDIHDTLYEDIKSYCQNKSIPLKDRWDIFIEADMGDHYSYINYYHQIVTDYIDRGWCQRHETIRIDNIEEWYAERFFVDFGEDFISEEFEIQLEKALQDFREATLDNFIKSFELDW